MGQKSSHFTIKLNKTKLPLSWALKTEHNPNPEQPIKFHYKTKRKTNGENDKTTVLNNINAVKSNNLNEQVKCRIVKTQNAPVRTKSEPSLVTERSRHRRRKRSARLKSERTVQQFGYEIGDVDAFLSKVGVHDSHHHLFVISKMAL